MSECERAREREWIDERLRDGDRDRATETERQRETEKQSDRETERQRETESEAEKERKTDWLNGSFVYLLFSFALLLRFFLLRP